MPRCKSPLKLLVIASLTFGFSLFIFSYNFTDDINEMFIKLQEPQSGNADYGKYPKLHSDGIEEEEQRILADTSIDVESRIEKVNQLRKDHLAKQCLVSGVATNVTLFDYTHPRLRELIRIYKESSDKDPRSVVPRLLVSDQHKALYCAIDGVALETWEKAIMQLEQGMGKSPEKFDDRYLTPDNLRPLWNYRPTAVEYRLKNYYKFMFVRNPIDRLMYAFRHRLPSAKAKTDNSMDTERLVEKIQRKFGEIDDETSLKTNISVSQFILFLKDFATSQREVNPMFGTFTQLCMPCHIQYDFIGKSETLKDDFDFALKKIKVEQQGFEVKAHDQMTLNDLSETLAKSQKEDLYKMYWLDFSVFGYSFP